jgi:hypothetical protein
MPAPDIAENALRYRIIAWDNANLIDSIPSADGFYSLYPEGQRTLSNWLATDENHRYPQALDFMGVRYVTDDRKPGERHERPSAMPLITAGQQPLCNDPQIMFYALKDPAFDPRRVIILPTEAEPGLKAGPCPNTRILRVDWQPQRIHVKVDFPQPALLVISQTHYPAWQATLDGLPAAILRANYAFQALDIPAGEHEVVLRYRDRAFSAGLAISVLALTGLATSASHLLNQVPHVVRSGDSP